MSNWVEDNRKNEINIAIQCFKKKTALPSILENIPELDEISRPYYEYFLDLDIGREIILLPNGKQHLRRLRWNDIFEYGSLYLKLEDEMLDSFIYIMKTIDSAVIFNRNKKNG